MFPCLLIVFTSLDSFDADSRNLCKMSEGLFSGILAFAGAALWVFTLMKNIDSTFKWLQTNFSWSIFILAMLLAIIRFLFFSEARASPSGPPPTPTPSPASRLRRRRDRRRDRRKNSDPPMENWF